MRYLVKSWDIFQSITGHVGEESHFLLPKKAYVFCGL